MARSLQKVSFSIAVGIATSMAIAASNGSPEQTPASIQVGDFALLDQHGEFHQLSRYRHRKALVVMSHDPACAADRRAIEDLDRIRAQWEAKDVSFALMNSAANQSQSAAQAESKYPVLVDHAQLVAQSLGLQTTGSVVVLDPDGQKVLYRGGANGPIADVLEAKLSGQSSGQAQPTRTAPVTGCAIDFTAQNMFVAKAPDYAKDIAPILIDNCAACHRDGGIGPFAMNSYAMARGWSPMIREVLMTKRMPPMQVDPHIGRFSNARYISDRELQTLVHWIDAGAPRGNGQSDPLAEWRFQGEGEWQLGQPDVIVSSQTHEIPAVGVIDYINDTVELEFAEDRWVKAVQFIPSDPSVLHHVLTYVTAPNEEFDGGEGGRRSIARSFLEGYAPGKIDAMVFPTDTGVYIPKGHRLSLQNHYTANGRATRNTTRIGLYFHDKPPKYEYLNRSVSGPVKIPPYAINHKTQGEHVFKEDVVVHGLRAHMHFRGRDMKFTANLPDGTVKELLNVANYSYAWQPTYQMVEPVVLPKGTKVLVTGSFDNSQYNAANPDPSKEIAFGLQSWDEMFIGYWSYHTVKPKNP